MYGRGGRGRGRSSGRGRNGFGGRTTNNTVTKPKERELKFSPIQYQGRTTVATYATTKDALIQHIQKTYRGGIDVQSPLKIWKRLISPKRNR
jgi:hypothetical protein